MGEEGVSCNLGGRTSQRCEGLVRARLDRGTRRRGSETRTALATAASIVTRPVGTVTLVAVGIALALPGVTQASPSPDPSPQAAPSSGGAPAPDPAPQARSSSSSGSSVGASPTSGPRFSNSSSSSSSSGDGSSSGSAPVVIQPSISGAAVAEPSTSSHRSSRGTPSTVDQVPLRSVPLKRAAHKTHSVAHRAATPRTGVPHRGVYRHFYAIPALTVLSPRLTGSARNGVLLLLGAGAFLVLAGASGSLMRMLRRPGRG
jgi:hypothetical protein